MADGIGGDSLRLAVAQPLSRSNDVAGNAERHAAAVEAAGARLVVFPELSLTGYEMDADVIDPSDHRLTPLVAACRLVGSVALVGAPVAGPEGDHIGVLRIDGDGAEVVYHKMWLGGSEPDRFVPGRQPAVIEVDGWRLGLAVCKDTGVAEHAAATAAAGIDAYVAGALERDRDRDVQPARARRISAEHGVWVAVASFAGSTGDGYDVAAGRSGIWRPGGSEAARTGPAPGEVATAVLDRWPTETAAI